VRISPSALWRGLLAYADSPDRRVAASNWVSIVVALDQPFYPVYIWVIVGWDHGVSLVTWLTTPFFALAPALSRRFPTLSRATLPVVGAANSMLACKAFGPASGVELFLFPCAMAGAMAFRGRERKAMIASLAAVAAAYYGLHGRMGAPLHVFTDDAYARFLSMNIFSVAGLICLIALQFSRAD
jgi:hypothetical protein